MEAMKMELFHILFIVVLFLFLFQTYSNAEYDHAHAGKRGSILFPTMERPNYYFDVYSLPTMASQLTPGNELKLTDGRSINFNGYIPPESSSLLSLLPDENLTAAASPPLHLIYVTERDGASSIFLDIIRSTGRVQVSLVSSWNKGLFGMKDRANLVGDHLVYVSTHKNPGVPWTSWAAVYSTHLKLGSTRRLTPSGLADFSPAVSPSGVWTAVASFGRRGWGGEVQELNTSIYIFRTKDGSDRVQVVERGGWPCWVDDSTLYYHRKSDDGWWSIYSATLPKKGETNVVSVVTERLTPPGLHAFTPATSPTNKTFIAVATRRSGSNYRHIELFDIVSKNFTEVTRPIAPTSHHYNPFLFPDSTRVGYHRCRARDSRKKGDHLLLENRQSPLARVSLFRIDGYFPCFSPDGQRLTFAMWPGDAGLYIANRDGSGFRKLFNGQFRYKIPFGTVWDPVRKGIIYASIGVIFGEESERVDVVSLNVDIDPIPMKNLTTGGANNAFPSPSPDGKWIVFRSGRSGYKNLYIMDAVEGEKACLFRLTDGPWDDTMPNWSPDGKWIIFSSSRDNPGTEAFKLYMIRPDGTGLKKFFDGGPEGRANHAWFSPDMKSIVFDSDYAAVSAEPISYPHSYQPWGDVYSIKMDGTGLKRLTHSAYEDGPPTWAATYLKPVDVKHPVKAQCLFHDDMWLKPPSSSIKAIASVSVSVATRARCAQ